MLVPEFLGAIVPPGAYLYIVEKQVRDNGGVWWKHYPVRSPEAAQAKIDAALQRHNDVYFATAAYQQGFVPQPTGKPRPSRELTNIHSLRSFWLDIDVQHEGKDPSRAYPSAREALQALQSFLAATQLPNPQIIVSSGNGLHVYWTTDEALPLDAWQRAAAGLANAARQHGLLCDYNVTKTATAILRVPQTYNFKDKRKPLPVQVLGSRPGSTPGAAFRSHMEQWVGEIAPIIKPLNGSAAPSVNDALRANLPALPTRPRTQKRLLEGCGVIQHMHATRGAGVRFELWRDMISIVALLDDGEALAHEASDGHSKYTEAETSKFYHDARAKDRPARCTQFSSYYPEICKACPRFGKITSPIETAIEPATATPIARGIFMPPGFTVNQLGELSYHYTDQDGKDSIRTLLRGTVAYFDAYERVREEIAEVERLIEVRLLPTGGQRMQRIRFPPAPPTGTKQARVAYWAGLNLSIDPHVLDRWEDWYMSSYRELLQEQLQKVGHLRRVVNAYGWTPGRTGFAVGRTVYNEDGSEGETAAEDLVEEYYTPVGRFEDWQRSGQVILDQLSPELQMMVAASFGAPLVDLLSSGRSYLMNFRSERTGTGKSTAITLAATVWAHPTHGMMSVSDTENAAFKKVGTLRHLPLLWDELRGTSRAGVDLIFRITQGKEKTRMTAAQTLKEGGAWSTLLACASNESLLDRAVHFFPSSEAGLARVFEVAVPPLGDRRVNSVQLDRHLAVCRDNFGHAGRVFAKYVAQNRDAVAKHVKELADHLHGSVHDAHRQRFWLGCTAVILAGAYFAEKAGILKFNMPALMDALTDTLGILRDELQQTEFHVERPESKEERALKAVEFVNAFISGNRQQMLKTDHYNMHGPAGYTRPLVIPANNKTAIIHIAVDPPVCFVAAKDLRAFAFERGVAWATVKKEWFPALDVKFERRTMGAGTHFSRGQVDVATIPLTHPDLAPYAQDPAQLTPGLADFGRRAGSPGSS